MKTMLLKSTRNSFGAAALALAISTGGLYSPPTEAALATTAGQIAQIIIEEVLNNEMHERIGSDTHERLDNQFNKLEQQYRDMLVQGGKYGDQKFDGLNTFLKDVINAYNDTRAIGKALGSLDDTFREMYPDYGIYLDNSHDMMPGRYKKWADSGFDNARTALLSAGMNVSSFQSEEQMLSQILNRSTNAAGRMQAIQAGNEIAAQNIQQLQKLRDMMQTQITMQSNHIARETQKEAVDDAFNEKFFSVRPNNSADQEF